MTGRVVGHHPDIPPGTYTVAYCGYETAVSWNSKKIKVRFSVVEGDYAGLVLLRYYNALEIFDPIGPNGDFAVADRGALAAEFRRIFPDEVAYSEIDLNRYEGQTIKARVGHTKKSGLGKELHQANRYSVIRELLEPTGGVPF